MRRRFHRDQRQSLSAWKLDRKWHDGWIQRTFEIVWAGYDRLQEHYSKQRIQAKNESEDEITFSLLRQIDAAKEFFPGTFRPLTFHNQPPDKSQPRNRKRNTNDIGVFFGLDSELPDFILEAKKVDRLSESGIRSYLEDLNAFLDGHYGAHLPESGLIAYLHSGKATRVFEIITGCLRTVLEPLPDFANRPHKVSGHIKTGRGVNKQRFACHHLVLELF